MLTSLPEGAEPTTVAHISLGAGASAMQEDVRGVAWVQMLVQNGAEQRASSVEWLIVPGQSKRAAVIEWQRRNRGRKGGPWPTAEELQAVGIDNVVELTQSPAQLLLLPPHALAVRRAGLCVARDTRARGGTTTSGARRP